MVKALELLRQSRSQRYVDNRCVIPTRTFRSYLDVRRKLGANSMFKKQKEDALIKRIIRFP